MCNIKYDNLISQYFHGEKDYNCAQTVLIILKENFDFLNISYGDIDAAQTYGGGRAPNGYCGALYAALSQVNDEKKKQELLDLFKNKIESLVCREIRSCNKKTCKECILASLESFENLLGK